LKKQKKVFLVPLFANFKRRFGVAIFEKGVFLVPLFLKKGLSSSSGLFQM
jgi:hypothetical protein